MKFSFIYPPGLNCPDVFRCVMTMVKYGENVLNNATEKVDRIFDLPNF